MLMILIISLFPDGCGVTTWILDPDQDEGAHWIGAFGAALDR
jgi:hypothetical protein